MIQRDIANRSGPMWSAKREAAVHTMATARLTADTFSTVLGTIGA